MSQDDAPKTVTAAILVIGDEILSGRTQDANLHWLAGRLYKLGVKLREARVVADAESDIVAALDALRARYDYVFTTGGIGPTHDDVTSACVAKAFGVALERNAKAVALLESHYADKSMLNDARLRMADIPAGATLIDNPISKAPGYRIGNVFVLAGVPAIMRAMFDGVAPTLTGGAPFHARTVSCMTPEGAVADGLAAIQARRPELDIGSYPYMRQGRFGTSLVVRGTDRAAVEAAAAEIADLVRSLGDAPILSEGMA